MKRIVTITNAGLAFALEIGMLAALCYWGVRTGRSTFGKTLLGIGAPAAGIAVWATFLAAGGHSVHLPTVVEAALKLGVFLLAAVALGGTGHRRLGIAFAALAVLSVVVEYTVGT